MSFQIACLCEFSSTFITFKKGVSSRVNWFEGGVHIVQLAMLNEIARLCKIFSTDYANKRFLPRMIARVCFQMTKLCKSLFTYFAREWLFSRVSSIVWHQISLLCKGLFTEFTIVCFPLVNEFVCFEVFFFFERFSAVIANVWSDFQLTLIWERSVTHCERKQNILCWIWSSLLHWLRPTEEIVWFCEKGK